MAIGHLISRMGQWSYSMTMQWGKCWEQYLKSSAVAPGQLVSSSSSSSCSWMRPDRPLVVSRGQPRVTQQRDCGKCAGHRHIECLSFLNIRTCSASATSHNLRIVVLLFFHLINQMYHSRMSNGISPCTARIGTPRTNSDTPKNLGCLQNIKQRHSYLFQHEFLQFVYLLENHIFLH